MTLPTLRGFCRRCNRFVALRCPRGGDGSLWVTVKHGPRAAPCPGSGEEAQ